MISPQDYTALYQDNIETSVAFTGHRSYRVESTELLDGALESLYGDGYRTFLSGMAVGFDMAAAESVLRLRAIHNDVRLVCVVPFSAQNQRFVVADRWRYTEILNSCDHVVLLSKEYFSGCYQQRNDFLVDHCSTVVAWFDGSSGGTAYTLDRAYRWGSQIVNLHLLSNK